MESILLVCSTSKSSEILRNLLLEIKPFSISPVFTAKAARQAMDNDVFSLVIINTPLGDEFGHDLALQALESGSGVLLLVRQENTSSIYQEAVSMGIPIVPKPLNHTVFTQSVRLALSLHGQMVGLQKKNEKLQSQLEEMRLIARAKCALIQYVSMTEPQAHRYIEKYAMDMRLSRKEVALTILKTYED